MYSDILFLSEIATVHICCDYGTIALMGLVGYLQTPLRYREGNVCLWLIGINVGLFLISQLFPALSYLLSMTPVEVFGRNYWWQLVTYMFMHANFSHLLLNMLGLYFFGMRLEQTMGSNEFLLFYFVCGAGAGALSLFGYLLGGQLNITLLGASGAVYAVLLAFATYFPHARIYLFAIFPVPAPLLIIVFTVIAVFSTLTSSGRGVAHLTHLAGFVFAFLYLLVRLRINPINALFRQRY